MKREALANKILVLGIDGMDPKLTRKYVDQGIMPNVEKLINQGACRKDLVMLGAQPTVTPPMWTTMATGAYPYTHGITCFYRQSKEDLDVREYNLDSTNCHAEPLWNVFAEAGKKTLVWHWPGSSWPPTSDSPNLHVVDGTQPAAVNMGVATTELDFVLTANRNVNVPHFRPKASSDKDVPCVLDDLQVDDKADEKGVMDRIMSKGMRKIILKPEDGENVLSETPFDIVFSPVKEAQGWVDAPADAKEITILYANGLIRRPSLLLRNEDGVYDRVAVYKSKKETSPLYVLPKGVLVTDIIDESLKNDQKVMANRSMRVIELAEDGESVKIWSSGALEINNDTVWHPHSLYKKVAENVGHPKLPAILGGANKQLLEECMIGSWDEVLNWNANALNYLIDAEGYDVIFSQVHNIDAEGHMFLKFLKDKGQYMRDMTEADYAHILELCYRETDEYIGKFMHLLDKGWTVLVISDHAQCCPEHNPHLIGDMGGLNAGVMSQLGLTVMKKDEDGNDLYEVDWEKTKAVQIRGNHIYLNLKGRNKHTLADGTVIDGIVDPKDQYEVEEEIMTKLYGLRDEQTGKRIIALALRNRDAILLGQGGPEAGDIIFWNAEGYNYDHCDILSTTLGYADTSVSPIFIGAGPGLKPGYTERVIRQVDLVPTIAILGGVRMPAQCEGAPVYQILAEEY